MLVNMLGIEEDEEIVDLSSQRTRGFFDPKARVTLTTLLGGLLSSFITLPARPTYDAQHVSVIGFNTDGERSDPELHVDAARPR